MKFAILIVTYTSPKQTKRLIQCLNNGEFDFYIHLDKKINIETHAELFDVPNVYFVKDRIDVKWAGFTTAEAALSSIRHIAATGIKYASISLISGQDYPIKPVAYISDFLKRNAGKEFMFYEYFEDWPRAIERVEKYHFNDFDFKPKYRVEKMLNSIMPKRKFPMSARLCGRETFWTLTQECAVYVTKYIDGNPRLRKFLRFTWGPDEFIFQTIIMDSPFRNHVINKNYRYINWPTVGDRPNIFVAADFDRIMAAEGLFGRKFDINTDEKIFDLLDNANGTLS